MLLSVADVALLQGSESRGKRLSKKSIAGADAVAALTDDDLRCACTVSRYHVRTQRGFLNIHSTPDAADQLDNVVGRLEEAEQIVALEHRPGWVRHARGWSVSRLRGDSWLWLIPEHPQVLAPCVDLIQSSTNTHYSHLVRFSTVFL